MLEYNLCNYTSEQFMFFLKNISVNNNSVVEHINRVFKLILLEPEESSPKFNGQSLQYS